MAGGFKIKKLYDLDATFKFYDTSKVFAQDNTSSSNNGVIIQKNPILVDGNILYTVTSYRGVYGLHKIDLTTGEDLDYEPWARTSGESFMMSSMWLENGELRYWKTKTSYQSLSSLSEVITYDFHGNEVDYTYFSFNLSTNSVFYYNKIGNYLYITTGPFGAGYGAGTSKAVNVYLYYIRKNLTTWEDTIISAEYLTTYVGDNTNVGTASYGYGIQGAIAYSATEYPDFRPFNPHYNFYLGGSYGTIKAGDSYAYGGKGKTVDGIIQGESFSLNSTYGMGLLGTEYVQQYQVNFGDDIYMYSIINATDFSRTKYHYQFSYSASYEPKKIEPEIEFDVPSAPYWDNENNRYLVADNNGVYSIEYEQYDKTLTVCTNSGEEYGTLSDLGTITSITSENTDGIVKLTITSPQTGASTFQYETKTPTGYNLLGYAYSTKGGVVIPINTTVTVNLPEGVKLYEVYAVDIKSFGMNIYKNIAEAHRVDKTSYLTKVGTIYGAMREATSITHPSFNLYYEKFPDFNYIYISEFNRYYFVDNITSIRTNLWRIECSVDVLMSYKDSIVNLTAHIDRNELYDSPTLPDTERVITDGVSACELAIVTPTDRPAVVMTEDTQNRSGYCMVINGYRLTVKES